MSFSLDFSWFKDIISITINKIIKCQKISNFVVYLVLLYLTIILFII